MLVEYIFFWQRKKGENNDDDNNNGFLFSCAVEIFLSCSIYYFHDAFFLWAVREFVYESKKMFGLWH